MGAFLRKYGTGTGADIYLPMIKRGVVDQAVGADWTPAAGDVKLSIDGAAAANIGTLPTAVAMGNGAQWKFVFADAELQGKRVVGCISDSATKAVEDQFFVIETYGHASAMYQADLSAASLPANLTQIIGDAQSATDLKDFADAGYDPATNKVQGVVLVDTVTTNTDMRGTDSAALATELAKVPKSDGAVAFNATAVNAIKSGLSTLDAAGVRTAVGMGSANLDAQLNSLPDAVTDAIETEYILQQDTNDTIYQAIKYGGRPLVVSTVAGTPTSTEIRTTSVPLEAIDNDSFFDDAQFYIASGPGKGQPPRPVLSFSTPSSGVYIFTFDEPWIVLPDAGDTVGMLLNHTHPKSQVAASVWSAAGRTLSGTLGSFDAIWTKIKAWLRLALRNDSAIAADHAAELAEINQDMGTGAGSYDPAADSDEARAEAIAALPTLAAILAGGDVDGYSIEESQKLILAGMVGVLAGAATGTITIEAADGSKTRITASVDADGNRSVVVLDATG